MDEQVSATKVCRHCEQERPVEAFYKQQCLECRRAYNRRRSASPEELARRRQSYAANPERLRSRNREWWATHKDDCNARRREEHAANPEPKREESRRYRERHIEVVRARDRARNQRRRDQRRQWMLAWQRRNREYLRAYQRQYYAQNPERARFFSKSSSHARRLAKAGTPNRLTKQQWLGILDYFNYRCAYCLQPLDGQTPVLEHLIPLSRGGQHDPLNVVPSCQPCNNSKFNRTPIEFLLYQARKVA